jgi:hypothetical protein
VHLQRGADGPVLERVGAIDEPEAPREERGQRSQEEAETEGEEEGHAITQTLLVTPSCTWTCRSRRNPTASYKRLAGSLAASTTTFTSPTPSAAS